MTTIWSESDAARYTRSPSTPDSMMLIAYSYDCGTGYRDPAT